MDIASDHWIPDGLDPLRRTLDSTFTKALAKYRAVVDGFLAQADKAVGKCNPGREIFRTLLNKIFYTLPSDSRVSLSE